MVLRLWRKPHAASLARAIASNRSVVEAFYTKYSETLGKHRLVPQLMYSVNEGGFSIVHNTLEVVAVKGSKQVGSVTSEERERERGGSLSPSLDALMPWDTQSLQC
jgi:hypothetical protein